MTDAMQVFTHITEDCEVTMHALTINGIPWFRGTDTATAWDTSMQDKQYGITWTQKTAARSTICGGLIWTPLYNATGRPKCSFLNLAYMR